MAGDKFLRLDGTTGRATEQAATDSSAGAGNAGDLVALDSAGRIAENMMPLGIVPETITFTASETLSAGNFVNLWNDGGTLKGRKADNSNGRQADCFVTAGVPSGESGTGYTEGTNAGLSSLTIMTRYFLGTAGGVTATVPAAGSGVIVQELGYAKSATELVFDPKPVIERAA